MCLGVPKGSWLVRTWSWLQPDLPLARHIGWGWTCPGRPLLWLEVTWPEAQPEFAGLGLAVCCVEAGFGGCGGSRFPSCAGLQDVCDNNWSVPCSTIGACLKPRWAGLGGAGQTLLRDHKVWMGLSVESVLSSTLFSLPFFSSLFCFICLSIGTVTMQSRPRCGVDGWLCSVPMQVCAVCAVLASVCATLSGFSAEHLGGLPSSRGGCRWLHSCLSVVTGPMSAVSSDGIGIICAGGGGGAHTGGAVLAPKLGVRFAGCMRFVWCSLATSGWLCSVPMQVCTCSSVKRSPV